MVGVEWCQQWRVVFVLPCIAMMEVATGMVVVAAVTVAVAVAAKKDGIGRRWRPIQRRKEHLSQDQRKIGRGGGKSRKIERIFIPNKIALEIGRREEGLLLLLCSEWKLWRRRRREKMVVVLRGNERN